MSQKQSKMCNRCQGYDDKGAVITAQFKQEGYVCRDCFDEYKKFYDGIANDFIKGRSGSKTLRDEFAMAALNGLLSTTKSYWMGLNNPETNMAAKFSYILADSMLEARKAKGD